MVHRIVISIDGWQIDSDRFRIRRDKVEKKLEPRSMELLLYLAERPGEVVTRQQIEDDVWRGRVVGYDALSGSIAKIRKAFDDDRKNPRIIETIPKAGYRLIAPVTVQNDADHGMDPAAETEGFERKLSAIFYADVAEYSRLTGEDEDRTHHQLRANMTIISEAIVAFQGRVIHYAGDAVLADFSTASVALHCALEVQQKISTINSHLSEQQQVLFRIGVNLGEVIVDGQEIYGDGVNVAARLESLAQPGGVCVSGTVFDAIGQKQEFEFEYLGENAVKNIQRPVQTYAVHLKQTPGLPAHDSSLPPLVSASRPSANASRRWTTPALIAGLIVLLLAGFYLIRVTDGDLEPDAGQPGQAYDPDNPSIAILPFKSMSNDPEQQFYSDGLTDDLITDLSNVEGLQVAPRHASVRFGDQNLSPSEISNELRVRYLVQGSVRRSFEEIRVNIQMIDSHNGQEVWAQRFDDNIENLFKLQDHIVDEIVKYVGLDPGQKPPSPRGTTNLEAYDYYLRAEHRRLNDDAANRDHQTIELYRRAIELDPSYVAAHTGLAREALINWQLDANQIMPPAASKKLVYDHAGRVLELDPNNAEALSILGMLQAISGVHDAGIVSVERALAANSANPQLHADLAKVLSYGGRHPEALQSIDRAFALHPAPPKTYFAERARINFFLGQYPAAASDASQTFTPRDPRNFAIFIQGALNDTTAAQDLVRARLQLTPWENQAYYRVIYSYYRRPRDIELIVDSAATAGIPRFAYGFDPGARRPLAGSELLRLTGNSLWHGKSYSGAGFFQQFFGGNRLALRTSTTMLSGTYHVDNDRLCAAFVAVLRERPDCGHVYRDQSGGGYAWVTLGDVYRFAVDN